tara:strand:+ start:1099 stop:1332 length:234 start_codon:yes stop_codon:yes gene_type:complete
MKKFLQSNLNSLIINLFLLIFLLIAIQNNHEKKIIKLFNIETIELPISFITGVSFIAGSFCGNFVFTILNFKKQAKE